MSSRPASDDLPAPPTTRLSARAQGCVLDVRGELDLAAAPGLLADVRRALDRGCTPLVLDLHAVSFADSTALAALIQVRRAAVRAGSELVLVCGDGPVSDLLRISGLDAVFALATDAQEALRAA